MKTMDHVKKRIIISMLCILLLIITLFGITYAYFTSKVIGNDKESISVQAGKLALEYGDGNGVITAEKIKPGTVFKTKTFTVKNTGTHIVESYEVIVENITNDLTNYKDLTYELTCKSYKTSDYEELGTKAAETGTCNGANGIFPKTDDYLVRNSIEKDTTHYYEIVVTYNETNKDQSIDMNKKVEAKINIIDDETNYKKILVYGNSIQDGTPSPTTPVEIESVGDKKNLLNTNYKMPYTTTGLTVSKKNNGIINVKGIANNIASLYLSQNLNLTLPAGTYTLSNTGIEGINVYLLPGWRKDTFTLTETTTFTGAYIDVTSSIIGQDIDFDYYPQLEKGEKATEYVPYGKYSIEITTTGKNLFALENYEGDVGWGGIKDPTYTKVKVKPNTSYRFSVKSFERLSNIDSGDIILYVYGDSSLSEEHRLITHAINLSGNTGIFREPFSATINVGNYEEIYCVLRNNQGTKTNIKITGMMLKESGDTTNFEPYIEPQTYNIILDEPLRKVGDCDTCADYIDLVNNTVVRNVNKYTFTGSEDWVNYGEISGNNSTLAITDANYSSDQYVLSNEYIGNKSGGYSSYDSGNVWLQSTNTYPRLYIHDSNYTKETLKTHLEDKYSKGEPVYVIYPLATTSEPEKLNINVPKIDKNSIITIGTTVQPSKIETEY